ncbi:MAG TPA: tRNA preQ1(34) S-adenosylmethionine ribosyltransferase-isomerase QueA [Firmicutes bacterium]|nr:tRNA preQ1(34) S-adenosylmethionine ribosyltransferase-isomerase QueA [Bacillota bacterium]
MRVDEFDYYLPPELIAQEPVEPRDRCRLMVLRRHDGTIEHREFKDIVDYLRAGDVLVLNNTRVIRARLSGRRKDTGGKLEILLLREIGDDQWEVLVKPGRRARVGSFVSVGDGTLDGEILDKTATGGRRIRFTSHSGEDVGEVLRRCGMVPLPPYIKKEVKDEESYQTIYAELEGSVAAPTAGLHFTRELLDDIEALGVKVVKITLHVGIGTFRPIKVANVEEHTMHEECYEVPPEAAGVINEARSAGGRVVAVGTTSVRTLETVADPSGRIHPGHGWTNIFIYPGYNFKAVDALVTNFHLPKSTLIMLVAAFCGKENIMRAYKIAVDERYRFFSFGDAMLII